MARVRGAKPRPGGGESIAVPRSSRSGVPRRFRRSVSRGRNRYFPVFVANSKRGTLGVTRAQGPGPMLFHGSHLTHRWRERDSNYRSLGHGYLELARPALGCDFFRGNTHFSGATSCSTCQRSPAARPLTIFGLVPLGSERPCVFMVCSIGIRRLGQAISGQPAGVSAGTAFPREVANSEHVRNLK